MDITFTDDPTGATKLEAVVKAWGEVQAENKAQRKWVTADQWNEWVNYDKETAHALTHVIDRYDGVRLTDEDAATLDRIIVAVAKAERVTEEEFIARRDAEIVAEMQRKLDEESAAEKKKALKGFKSTLKGFFHL
jgi:23S rRNA G2069 N7-methylase RlmK/C1962 C5-methylase RlmI